MLIEGCALARGKSCGHAKNVALLQSGRPHHASLSHRFINKQSPWTIEIPRGEGGLLLTKRLSLGDTAGLLRKRIGARLLALAPE